MYFTISQKSKGAERYVMDWPVGIFFVRVKWWTVFRAANTN